MSARAWQCIILANLMKFMCKLVEFEFSSLDPIHFHWSNTGNTSATSTAGETCHYNDSQADGPSDKQTFTSWVFTARYLIPVLGGLVSSAWLGCTRVLQIGGTVMLLSTSLLTVSVYLGLMCQASPIIPITWLLLPVFYGLIQPNVLLALFCWHRKNKLSTVVTTIYYAVAALGELISMPFLNTATARALGSNFTLLFLAASVSFLILTAILPEVREEEAFELPSRTRMMKYFQVFSALILFLTFVGDDRATIYISEMSHFMNETVDIVAHPWLSPDLVKNLSLLAMAPPMILAAVMSRRRLSVSSRMLFGILLKAAVELFLVIVTSVGLTSTSTTVAVYSLVSILDGVSELLVMVGAYDLGCSILPASSQCLILGVIYTVRGLSNFVSRGLLLIANEIYKSRAGSTPLLFVFHLIALLMLLGCLANHKFITLPMAAKLAEPPDDDEMDSEAQDPFIDDDCYQDSNAEHRPLLNAV